MKTVSISEAEVTQFRAEASGTANRIHFNNAGCSLPADGVVRRMVDYLKKESLLGGYELEDQSKKQLENVYHSVALLINADVNEIALVENASAAWGIAFNGIDLKKGDEIITSEYEYASNFIGMIHAQKSRGIIVRVIPNDADGHFCMHELEKSISPNTKLIAVTHILSTGGGVLPIVEIGKIAARHGILFLLDACQSVGQLPLNVKEIHCDMLAATGRKYLRAPRGTGFLYVRKSIQDQLIPVLMDGHGTEWMSDSDFKFRGDARRFELYEKNRALILGMGEAIDYALNIGIERIWERVQKLADIFRSQLRAIEGITVHDRGSRLCGIVSFSADGTGSVTIKELLALDQINVSIAVARSAPFYMHKNGLDKLVRASVHYYNTEEEISFFCQQLSAVIKKSMVHGPE